MAESEAAAKSVLSALKVPRSPKRSRGASLRMGFGFGLNIPRAPVGYSFRGTRKMAGELKAGGPEKGHRSPDPQLVTFSVDCGKFTSTPSLIFVTNRI